MRGRKTKIKPTKNFLISPSIKPRRESNYLSGNKNEQVSVNIKIYLKDSADASNYDHLGYFDYLIGSYMVYWKTEHSHTQKKKINIAEISGYVYL